ncbi:unnamed protein product [Haemonchus placei]|uniref:Uncharacterized protein n=1 Tax=Haemonchus placei TaxID=6290 RepID=A0A0N4WPI3_HAEPC|nr:unnamed protein product [Haemonchus placei]
MFYPRRVVPWKPAPPRHPSRFPAPQEIISEDRSLSSSERLSLQIAQSLTIAANFEDIFSLDQLAARDLVEVDAFFVTLLQNRSWLDC